MNYEQPDVQEQSADFSSLHGIGCELDAEGHCISCSDEALPARVLRADAGTGVALVEIGETTEEVDITLVDTVAPDDVLLIHGGVAIGIYEEEDTEEGEAKYE